MNDLVGNELLPGDWVAYAATGERMEIGVIVEIVPNNTRFAVRSVSAIRKFRQGGDERIKMLLGLRRTTSTRCIKIDPARLTSVPIHRPYWIAAPYTDALKALKAQYMVEGLHALRRLSVDMREQYELTLQKI